MQCVYNEIQLIPNREACTDKNMEYAMTCGVKCNFCGVLFGDIMGGSQKIDTDRISPSCWGAQCNLSLSKINPLLFLWLCLLHFDIFTPQLENNFLSSSPFDIPNRYLYSPLNITIILHDLQILIISPNITTPHQILPQNAKNINLTKSSCTIWPLLCPKSPPPDQYNIIFGIF